MGATVLVILRAFANGGTSLTGLEAISNGVSAFQKPEGANARRALVIMASILAFLVSGVSLLAYLTHATPYAAGYPSVISQERGSSSARAHSATSCSSWCRPRPR